MELSEFFRLVAAELCIADRATYEIAYLEDSKTNKLVGFILFYINEQQIRKKHGQLFQIVPPAVANERNVSESITLPHEDLIIFSLPSALQKTMRLVRENLSMLSHSQMSSVFMEANKAGIPYDYKVHENSRQIALLKTCKLIGWTARGMLNERILSSYLIYLQLNFQKFKIQLREILLTALNDGLNRAGKKIGFQAKIEISGLPTIEEVDEAIWKLSSGKKPFTEILDQFRY
jgi:hypothetical protein